MEVGVRLLGDAYNRQAASRYVSPGAGPVALFKVLDKIATAAREWTFDGEMVRFRSKSWANDRRAEIPARYMRRWLAERDKRGGFTLDMVAEMVTLLRDEQVESLMFSAMEEEQSVPTEMVTVSSSRNVLRLWGKLLPSQRSALLAGRQLLVGELFPFQRAMVAGLNRGQNNSQFALAFGAKPMRTPRQLATAVLRVQHSDTAARRPPAPPAQGEKADAQNAMAMAMAMGGANSNVYQFELGLGDGQKDQFTVVLTRPQSKTAPALAPPAPPKAPAGR